MASVSTLNISVSGLKAAASQAAAAANNIANVNTVGYKAVEPTQTSVVTRGGGAGGTSVGAGVLSGARSTASVQGLLQASNASTDLAISGSGFFGVAQLDGQGNVQGVGFTRSGSFTQDASGFLTNAQGLTLLGLPTDASGNPTQTSPVPVQVGRVSGTAEATSQVRLGANLPAGAAIGAQQRTTVRVFDAQGQAHSLQLTFEASGTNRYDLTIITANATLERDGAGGGAYKIGVQFAGDGTLSGFDTTGDGTIDASTPPDVFLSGITGGASDQAISLNLGAKGSTAGLTQFASSFSQTYQEVDGAAYGNISRVEVGKDGTVTALFDNGKKRPIYQVPVTNFPNQDGLAAVSGNLFTETTQSGLGISGPAGQGGRGSIQASALETSNVDLGTEFSRLILAQTAYKANIKTFQAADENSRELLSILR